MFSEKALTQRPALGEFSGAEQGSVQPAHGWLAVIFDAVTCLRVVADNLPGTAAAGLVELVEDCPAVPDCPSVPHCPNLVEAQDTMDGFLGKQQIEECYEVVSVCEIQALLHYSLRDSAEFRRLGRLTFRCLCLDKVYC